MNWNYILEVANGWWRMPIESSSLLLKLRNNAWFSCSTAAGPHGENTCAPRSRRSAGSNVPEALCRCLKRPGSAECWVHAAPVGASSQ
jgi:hypothetical protein